jgi:hypothetical protein
MYDAASALRVTNLFLFVPYCFADSVDLEILCYFATKSLDEFLNLQQVSS